MVKKETYGKISPTAKFVAYIRTFTDIPFAKEIAAESLAKKDFEILAGKSAESITTQFIPLYEARYKATAQVIAQRSITQVLEIAAGLSPRGLAMTENPNVVYVATDLPQILEEEKAITEAILAKLNIHRPHLHFRIVNALDRKSLLEVATLFQSSKPIAIITEGLLPYFSREEKETLAGNIHDLLKKYNGIWITSDVPTKQSWGKISQRDQGMRRRIRDISRATERNIENNVFADEKDMRQFFTKVGFAIEEYPHSNVIENLSSVKFSNLSRQEILDMLRVGKTVILTPRDT